MTQYEVVPGNELSHGVTIPAPDNVERPKSKKTPQVYTQVPVDDSDHSQQSEEHVRNRCIRPVFLFALPIFFAACSLTVGLLYHFSELNNGLTTEREARRYLWIYGPTAGKSSTGKWRFRNEFD